LFIDDILVAFRLPYCHNEQPFLSLNILNDEFWLKNTAQTFFFLNMTTTTAQEEAPSFIAKLEARVAAIDSLLCVGLDPHSSELFPNGLDGVSEEFHAQAAFTFCKTIIDETRTFISNTGISEDSTFR